MERILKCLEPGMGDFYEGYNCPVEWALGFERALNAAEEAIGKYGISKEDFWITRTLSYGKDKIIYKDVVLSYAGCLRVNEQLPKEKKFNPEKVEQGIAGDGGVLFIYRSKEQGVFVTGEASRFNCGNLAYPGATAEKRVFCRYITRISGLYAEGIYTEAEAEDFAMPIENERLDVPITPHLQEEPASVSMPEVAAVDAPYFTEEAEAKLPEPIKSAVSSDKARLRNLMDAILETGTVLDKVLAAYQVDSLPALSESQLVDLEAIIYGRLQAKREKEAADISAMPQSMQAGEVQGISPVAQMIANGAQGQLNADKELPQAAISQAPSLGQTIYVPLESAPKKFQALSGKTLDEIGPALLKELYGRSNSAGRRHVSPELLETIERYLRDAA